mmetsp:Transcript_61959/g.138054  ORF Transcript_61959/g.138054 Transcript_61959/m.138054 type:complete len:210 (-) Transcript_61959:646-1275(-)
MILLPASLTLPKSGNEMKFGKSGVLILSAYSSSIREMASPTTPPVIANCCIVSIILAGYATSIAAFTMSTGSPSGLSTWNRSNKFVFSSLYLSVIIASASVGSISSMPFKSPSSNFRNASNPVSKLFIIIVISSDLNVWQYAEKAWNAFTRSSGWPALILSIFSFAPSSCWRVWLDIASYSMAIPMVIGPTWSLNENLSARVSPLSNTC